MPSRFLAAFFAVCLVAMSQTLTVEQLFVFLKNASADQEHKYTDADIAGYLSKVKLTEKLDDRLIEDLSGQIAIGPKSMAKLRLLRDRSQGLGAAKPIEPPPVLKPKAPPSSEEQAEILDDVRKYALAYTQNLPDFICTEVTRRFAAPAPGTKYGGPVSDTPHWQKMDELTTRLSFFEQKEDYKLILHNSTVSNQDLKSVGGAQSFGDFGTMLKQIFEPATQAHFEFDHWATIDGELVMDFAYRVTRERSQYHIVVDNDRSIITAYHGIIAVDPITHAVMRVVVVAENIPPDFPVKSAEDDLFYGYTDISGQKFLLPLKAKITMNGGDYITRNDKEFRTYRKYSADAVIKYDSEEAAAPPPPLDDTKTKETPVKPPPPATKKEGGH